MTAKDKADTTLNQIGGAKFKAMTGARNISYNDSGSLMFKLPRNSTKINYVKISINGLDLYDMEFHALNMRSGDGKLIAFHGNVYADMIRGIFERETGLRTSLTTVYA